jgi:hypothetical protein
MTDPDPFPRIEARLRELEEADQVHSELRGLNPLMVLADEVELLAGADEVEAVKQVVRWLAHYDAGSSLLQAIAQAARKDAALHSLLVRTLRFLGDGQWTIQKEVEEAASDVLPTMLPELRSVVFLCAPGLLQPNTWVEAKDYATLEYRPDPVKPTHEELAPLDSIEGRCQRLALLGYHSSDPPGTWQLGSRSAVALFQLDNELDATGQVDAATASCLEGLTYAALFWDPTPPKGITRSPSRADEESGADD